MRLNYLLYAIGLVIKYVGFMMLAPVPVAIYYHDMQSVIPFLVVGIISILIGIGVKNITLPESRVENLNDIKKSEALFIVAVSWVLFGLIAAIPYTFYGISPLNAVFESVSSITTTGASIFTHYDYPKTLFFWRSFTQWLGDMELSCYS